MPDVPLDCALHHSASIVVFNVAFPTWLRQVMVLCEALLAEVLDRIIVCVSQKVMQVFRLSMVLELVHKSRAIAFDLLLSRDSQKDDLSKFL